MTIINNVVTDLLDEMFLNGASALRFSSSFKPFHTIYGKKADARGFPILPKEEIIADMEALGIDAHTDCRIEYTYVSDTIKNGQETLDLSVSYTTWDPLIVIKRKK